jgi:murein DD-endopeptidase MepM/ murein hydrolase activator NlpD
MWEYSPTQPFVTDPIVGNPGVNVPDQLVDQDIDAVTDCWKNVTAKARLSSGFPYRNDGLTPHNGVDVVSDSSNYGRGAPIGSLGAGYVKEVGSSAANGNFVRVDQGDGNTVTYIHLLKYLVTPGQIVGVGTKLGEMNCTGNCGGQPGDPSYQSLTSTHVHIQVKLTNDSNAYKSAVELYGGANCTAKADWGSKPQEPPQQCLLVSSDNLQMLPNSKDPIIYCP